MPSSLQSVVVCGSFFSEIIYIPTISRLDLMKVRVGDHEPSFFHRSFEKVISILSKPFFQNLKPEGIFQKSFGLSSGGLGVDIPGTPY